MGMMGAYIDALPASAKDRVIEAQEWCIAEVLGPGRARCLVGHAEDWRAVQAAGGGRAGWLESALAVARRGGAGIDEFSPELFTFRGAIPADTEVYRARLERWGLSSECRIGSRFDRLCARRGMAAAVRMVKARAGFRLPVASCQFASYQLPAGSRQSSVVGRQSSVVSRRSSVFSRQSSCT